MKASLFVTTYDMPHHLELVCAGLERQRFRGFEVLICDDGSGPETKAVVDRFRARVDFPVEFFWQEHQGFRKCRILNQALRVARGEYCVFLDGDCIPHRDYVGDHVGQARPGSYLAGRRVELGPQFSSTLTIEQVRRGVLDFPHPLLIKSILQKDSEHLQRAVRIRSFWLRKALGMSKVDDLKGCNYSVAREDLLAINGFDEEFEGYGREDTDVELRLQNLGLQIRSLKGLALQFHVWHSRREFTPANEERLAELKRSRRIRCDQGVCLDHTPGTPSDPVVGES